MLCDGVDDTCKTIHSSTHPSLPNLHTGDLLSNKLEFSAKFVRLSQEFFPR